MFLASGTGHCGTGWFAEFMTRAGYRCGHESVYGVRTRRPIPLTDSSWLAMPFLKSLPEETPIVHLVRDPIEVLNSMYRSNDMRDRPGEGYCAFAEYSYKHNPQIGRYPDQVSRIMAHTVMWDEPVENRKGPRFILRVGEENDPIADNWDREILAEMIEFCTGRSVQPDRVDPIGRVNDHYRYKESPWTYENLPEGELADKMRDRAVRYGFLSRR